MVEHGWMLAANQSFHFLIGKDLWIKSSAPQMTEIWQRKAKSPKKLNCARNAIINHIYWIVSASLRNLQNIVPAETTFLYAATFAKPAFPTVSFFIQATWASRGMYLHLYFLTLLLLRYHWCLLHSNLKMPHSHASTDGRVAIGSNRVRMDQLL